jgi:hypothetical protein
VFIYLFIWKPTIQKQEDAAVKETKIIENFTTFNLILGLIYIKQMETSIVRSKPENSNEKK